MNKVPQQFAHAAQSATEALQSSTATLMSALERVIALNFETARATLEDGTAAWKTLIGGVEAPRLAILGKATQPSLESVVTYSRGLYAVLSETGAALYKQMERQVDEYQREMSGQIDQALKNAPPGSEAVVATMKSALASVHSTYENMTKSGKQVAESLHANIAASADAGLKAAGKLA